MLDLLLHILTFFVSIWIKNKIYSPLIITSQSVESNQPIFSSVLVKGDRNYFNLLSKYFQQQNYI